MLKMNKNSLNSFQISVFNDLKWVLMSSGEILTDSDMNII